MVVPARPSIPPPTLQGGAAVGPPPPPPSAQALHLISALSNPEPANVHVQALRARDEALSASLASYGELCLQLAFCLVGCDNPQFMLSRVQSLESWQQQDPQNFARLVQQDGQGFNDTLWIPFGQMAGLVLKNALIRPPVSAEGHLMALESGSLADHLKETLLYALGCQNVALRSVASSVIATTAVSTRQIQPALHIRQWPHLVSTLIQHLQPAQDTTCIQEGSLSTLQKMMEDGPTQLDQEGLDALVPALLRFLNPSLSNEQAKIHALKTLSTCLALSQLPSSLVLHFSSYLEALSNLAIQDPSIEVRKWVCKSLVTMLEIRTEYIQAHLEPVARFLLDCTKGESVELASEACEFWLTFSSLDESVVTPAMMDTIQAMLPQLIPVLLHCMVYQPEQRVEILARNELDLQSDRNETLRPVFHRSRANASSQPKQQPSMSQANDDDEDEDVDDDGYEQDDETGFDDADDDGHEWTLRKCAAASLDALANLYGAEPLLPTLLPELERALAQTTDPWIQEASILALGAIAEGCFEEMSPHLSQLHPYLMNHMETTHNPSSAQTNPPTPPSLPQVSCIAAWTLGRYAPWAVQQVQSGAQGHLLAQMTEVFMHRLTTDPNRRVQVAVCSALSQVVEAAGDLLTPYLPHIYRALASLLSPTPRVSGRTLLLVLDLFGNLADCCGPSIAEGELPSIYMPPIMNLWNQLANQDPTDRTLLPLMECLASISMTSGKNFQPYALECFENSMGIIEAVQLILASNASMNAGTSSNNPLDPPIVDNEEEADPIICATDLLDGLVEGLGSNFPALIASSQRFGGTSNPLHFVTVVHTLCQHDLAGVRMSALALLGDLARSAPQVLEPVLSDLLQHSLLTNMDPIQPTVCNNAVWAMGEICVRCQGLQPQPLEPFVPALMQNLIALLMGNGVLGDSSSGGVNGNHSTGMHAPRGCDIPGVAENAAACAGRLAKVNPAFVAPDLARFLMGWCDGMAKISDPDERRDAFQGFIQVLYTNPQAISQASVNVPDAVACILFAVITWHMPPQVSDRSIVLLNGGEYSFLPFPAHEVELQASVRGLVHDMKNFVGEEVWATVQRNLPVNVRRLLRENY